jgi:peroxiredoxin
MSSLGTTAPDFSLPGVDGETVSLSDFQGAPALLVIFMCNHCPFVKHVSEGLSSLVRDYQEKGVGIVGINANDVANHPEDSPEKMVEEARARGYSFPYLFDESQKVAQAYRAACTPDFFLFDGDNKLVYRGQMDGSRLENDVPVTGEDLRAAIDSVLKGEAVSTDQKASIGCNVKWRAGNEPEYFDAEGIA